VGSGLLVGAGRGADIVVQRTGQCHRTVCRVEHAVRRRRDQQRQRDGLRGGRLVDKVAVKRDAVAREREAGCAGQEGKAGKRRVDGEVIGRDGLHGPVKAQRVRGCGCSLVPVCRRGPTGIRASTGPRFVCGRNLQREQRDKAESNMPSKDLDCHVGDSCGSAVSMAINPKYTDGTSLVQASMLHRLTAVRFHFFRLDVHRGGVYSKGYPCWSGRRCADHSARCL